MYPHSTGYTLLKYHMGVEESRDALMYCGRSFYIFTLKCASVKFPGVTRSMTRGFFEKITSQFTK